MINIKFNDSDIMYECKFKKYSDALIKLTGNIPSNTSGFKAYSGTTLLGDYSDFTTIYKTFDGGIVFSNDGSVEPKRQVTLEVSWSGGEEHIPNYINVQTNIDYVKMEKPNWTKTYTIGEYDDFFVRSSTDVENFCKEITGSLVSYTFIEGE